MQACVGVYGFRQLRTRSLVTADDQYGCSFTHLTGTLLFKVAVALSRAAIGCQD